MIAGPFGKTSGLSKKLLNCLLKGLRRVRACWHRPTYSAAVGAVGGSDYCHSNRYLEVSHFLTSNFLMTYDVEHLFIRLFVICVSSLVSDSDLTVQFTSAHFCGFQHTHCVVQP